MSAFLAELALARAAAERAGHFIAERWDQSLHVEYKGEVDLVSEVDRGAEALVAELLTNACPQDGIVGEEGAAADSSSGRSWHIDPLDGTTNFSHGLPHFAVSVALVDEEGPCVGVVYDPIRRWTFHARRGHGAWLDGRRIHVSETTELGRALLASGFPYDRRTANENNVHRVAHLLRQGQGMRRAGAAALDLAFVAAGWLDGYWEDRLSSWDIAAGTLLVKEAGGQVTDFAGAPTQIREGALVASNSAIHQALLHELERAPLLGEMPS